MFLLSLKHRRDDGAFAVQDSNGDKVLFLFEEEDDAERYKSVSYTHLTLPTKRIV